MRSKELLDQRKWAALRKLLLPRIINVLANEEKLRWMISGLQRKQLLIRSDVKEQQDAYSDATGRALNIISKEERMAAQNAKLMAKSELKEFSPPHTTVHDSISAVLMGSGLMQYKASNTLDDTVKEFIRGGVQLGFDNPSNRQSAFEILEMCEMKMPRFLRPGFHSVQSCVSELVKNLETKKEASTGASNSSGSKTLSQKRQKAAATLSRLHRSEMKEERKGYLFRAKYLKILLLDNEHNTRIVTEVKFDATVGKATWYAEATRATRHPYDRRRYDVDPDDMAPVRYDCGKLSKLIKNFNK